MIRLLATLSGALMPSIFDPHTPALPADASDTRALWWKSQLQSGGALRIPGIVLRMVVAVVLLWGVSGWAQTMYRSTMPDGRVIFGDKPAPGAERVETINPSSRPANTAPPASGNEEASQQLELQRQQRAAHQRDIREAEEALRAAKAAQAAGKEPLPGERRGNANGTSRLTEEYWARQNALKADVAKARKRLNALRAGR
jgi:hypothetical protein